MKKARKKLGFTLAEVMVVLLVLTIMFAAFAPFLTKRRRNLADKQEVWMWSSRNYMAGPMDTYYKPLTNSNAGGIFIGSTPDSQNEIESAYLPLSKLTVRSGYIYGNVIQRQLQLRYGRNNFEDPGQFAGTLLADGTNLLFGGRYFLLGEKCSNDTYPQHNVAFGFNAMNSIKDQLYTYDQISKKNYCHDSSASTSLLENNTALGYNSLGILLSGNDNTAIGVETGNSNRSGKRNTLIGYYAGSKVNESSANTLIGKNSQSISGSYNTFVGAETGNAESCTDCSGTTSYGYNTALGYQALNKIVTGNYNIALGSGALSNLTMGNYNVAIGYNACFGLTEQSYKTCIGAWSGPAVKTPNDNYSPVEYDLGLKKTDNVQRTYIGANPNINENGEWVSSGKYGGDAVLEIHNTKYSNKKLLNKPSINSNATTIINGNLIVKGKTFFTMGDVLYPFYYSNNIFGTNPNVNCAADQVTYDFNTTNCSDLSPISSNTSDRRLKNIGTKYNYGLDKIKQLKVYNYTFKNDPAKEKHVGVIAQDLQKVFPNSVFKDDDNYLKIKTDEIFYSIINSIKEINKKLLSLANRVNVFENEITKMEQENSRLQDKIETMSLRIENLRNKH